jgi:hypothetical protein
MSDRVRTLFVGINYRYINPTMSLLPAALGAACELHFYGPGFVGDAILAQGIDRYVESIGGVDLVFTSKDFCGGYEADRLSRFVSRYVVLLNGGQVTSHVLADVSQFLQENKRRVIVSLIDVDPHAVDHATLDMFLSHGDYFFGWGEGFLNTLGDANASAREHHLRKKQAKGFTLGLFDEFVKLHAKAIINLGHFVSNGEFYWGSLANRRFDVAVPGARYARRQETERLLERAKGIVLAHPRYGIAYQIAERLSARPFSKFYLSHLYNLAFQRLLSRCKICITDGGMNNFPVRKFFEIPAAGALLVCWPATGMESLGFVSGVNCLFIRSEAEASASVAAVMANPGKFERVAAAGRDLVLREHSLSARTTQLRTAIQRIHAGTFAGSGWHDGRFNCWS